MAMYEQFSLRWNDFHKNLAHSFQALLEGEDLVDVTLAAGGQYVHAHKLILSVCSPYFKELFKMNPCEHPIVILKDVAHHELRQLLQFIYRGEVNVGRHELSAFLHTAELLQIKGLTTNGERSESPIPVIDDPPISGVNHQFEQEMPQPELVLEDDPMNIKPEPSAGPPPPPTNDEPRSPLKRYDDAQDNILLKNTPNKNSCNKKKMLMRPVNLSPTHPENMSIEYPSDGEPVIDIDSESFQNVLVVPKKETGAWTCKTKGVKCPSCHRIFANRYNLKVHVRDKHDTREGTLQCDICQKRMRNPSCLRVHLYHHRKQAAYLAQLGHVGGEQLRQAIQEMVGPNPEWRNENQYCDYGADNVSVPEASSSPRGPKEAAKLRPEAAASAAPLPKPEPAVAAVFSLKPEPAASAAFSAEPAAAAVFLPKPEPVAAAAGKPEPAATAPQERQAAARSQAAYETG